MALAQYNYPQPTGLQQLGDVLLKGSGDYANIQLQRQAEERRRQQQLADLQDQRQFAVGQRNVERVQSLSDEERRRQQAIDDTTLAVLIKEGWLKPTDARNPQAIQAAANARQVRLSETQQREAGLPAKFQKEADYLGEQDVKLAAVEEQLNAELSRPEPGPPTRQEVRQLAIRMTNKPVPSDQEISDMEAAATKAIMQDRYMRWQMAKEDAKTQIPLLRGQRTALRQSLSTLLQQGFTPNRPPPPAQALAAPGTALRPASAAETAAAAGGMTPPPPPSTTTPSPNDTLSFQDINASMRDAPQAALPALRQARTSALADQYAALDAPAANTRSAIGGLQEQIDRTQGGLNPSIGPTIGSQGQMLSRFLLQSKALQNQLTTQDQVRAAAKARLLQSLQAPLPPLSPLPSFQAAGNLDRSYDDPYARGY